MAAPTLQKYKLPRNLTPRSALDVATALTGHRKETDLVRYLALALHYASWSLDEGTLADYEGFIGAIEPESGSQLLDYLSSPAGFAIRGDLDSLPAELVRASQQQAKDWRRVLLLRDSDVLRLHHRTLGLLKAHLESSTDAQRMMVAELQVLDMCRKDEASALPEASRLGTSITVRKGDAAPAGAPAAVPTPEVPGKVSKTFSSPAEALAFILQVGGFSVGQGFAFAPGQPVTPGLQPHPEALAPAGSAPAEQADSAEHRVRVYDCAEAFTVLQKMPPASPNEGNNQQRRVLEQMAADPGWRGMTQTPDGEPLAEMYAHFPHFKPVLDHVARHLALASCGSAGKPVRIAPMLLRGAPGTGKTFFAQELARVLGTHFVERDLGVVSEAFVIAGFDATWRGSKPGIVFEALVNGKTANPLILLNEVDKAKVTANHNSPMAALYGLLEPTSAARFVDEFVPVHLDTTGVIWVLTANDGPVPEPIESRLDIFNIPVPSREQCRAIASSVWTSICGKTLPQGHGFDESLPEDLLVAVSAMSPRDMRKALTNAVGAAALAGRKYLVRQDLDVAAGLGAAQHRSIGFLA